MILKIVIGITCVLQTTMAVSAELSPTAQEWVDITLSRFGEGWDEDAGMLGNSRGHGTRSTMFHALGLLQRGKEADQERACKAIQSVCRQQFIAPGEKYHGTFSRSDREGPPEKNGILWKDYDPNWREFIGLSMILVLEQCNDAVDEIIRNAMLDALHYACEGAYERNVTWAYTNISLMSAYLLAWGGKQFDNANWKTRGEELSRILFENFKKHKTFNEYNSPTYNGVNLWALAAWRTVAPTPEMAVMGTKMEADLWRDIAQSYHAELGNMCGPYDRSYGMDMRNYFAITGIAIALATESSASIPDLANSRRHLNDMAYLPLLALLGLKVPDDVLPHLKAFQSERRYARIIEGGRVDRRAYSWLHERYMVGVETNSRVVRSSTQYHPFTVHWKNKGNEVCWLKFIGDTPVIVSLVDDFVQISPAHGGSKPVLCFEVYAPDAAASSFTTEAWNLPGITLKTPAIPVAPIVTQQRDTFTVSYAIAEDSENSQLLLRVEAEK